MSYPVLLHLEGRSVVVVGGGQVAACKVADLLAADAQVAVISPTVSETLGALVDNGTIRGYEEAFTSARLRELKPMLVFAATDSPAVNAQVIAQSHDIGALVGTVDEVPGGDLTSMAALRRGRITLAVATDGASPTLAVHLRTRLATVIGEEYEILADWLAELRPFVLEQLPSEDSRRALWRAIVGSTIPEHLKNGDEAAARSDITRLLVEAGIEEPVR